MPPADLLHWPGVGAADRTDDPLADEADWREEVLLAVGLERSSHLRLDPFLMLDEFSSNNADEYSSGFLNHPHRGFETVPYMLDGHMPHQDHPEDRLFNTPSSLAHTVSPVLQAINRTAFDEKFGLPRTV